MSSKQNKSETEYTEDRAFTELRNKFPGIESGCPSDDNFFNLLCEAFSVLPELWEEYKVSIDTRIHTKSHILASLEDAHRRSLALLITKSHHDSIVKKAVKILNNITKLEVKIVLTNHEGEIE